MAEGLSEPAKDAEIVVDMQTRLDAIKPPKRAIKTLYMTPGGVTSGPGSLVHQMLGATGLENYEEGSGWRSLPLETLLQNASDMVAAAIFDSQKTLQASWSAMRHPVARAQLTDRPTVYLDGAWTSCGGWYLLDAIEALAQGRPAA